MSMKKNEEEVKNKIFASMRRYCSDRGSPGSVFREYNDCDNKKHKDYSYTLDSYMTTHGKCERDKCPIVKPIMQIISTNFIPTDQVIAGIDKAAERIYPKDEYCSHKTDDTENFCQLYLRHKEEKLEEYKQIITECVGVAK
jgi:hypothetical protein